VSCPDERRIRKGWQDRHERSPISDRSSLDNRDRDSNSLDERQKYTERSRFYIFLSVLTLSSPPLLLSLFLSLSRARARARAFHQRRDFDFQSQMRANRCIANCSSQSREPRMGLPMRVPECAGVSSSEFRRAETPTRSAREFRRANLATSEDGCVPAALRVGLRGMAGVIHGRTGRGWLKH